MLPTLFPGYEELKFGAQADKFHWIPAGDLNFNSWNVLTEGFMAMRQTAILADLNKTDIEDVFYESKAYGYHQNMKVQDVYINEKIPFAYDYADKDPDVAPYDSDHGTHVAGIIGGAEFDIMITK